MAREGTALAHFLTVRFPTGWSIPPRPGLSVLAANEVVPQPCRERVTNGTHLAAYIQAQPPECTGCLAVCTLLHRTAALLYWAAAKLRLLHIIVLRPSHTQILWQCCFPILCTGTAKYDTRQLSNGRRGGPIPFLFCVCFSFFYPSQLQKYFVGKGCRESSARWYPRHGVRCPSHHVDEFLETAGSGGPLLGGGGVS